MTLQPQPIPAQADANAQLEALRSRAMRDDVSSVGLGGQTPQTPQPGQPGGGGAAGAPTAQATQALGQQKGEADKIISALQQRLKVLGERGE